MHGIFADLTNSNGYTRCGLQLTRPYHILRLENRSRSDALADGAGGFTNLLIGSNRFQEGARVMNYREDDQDEVEAGGARMRLALGVDDKQRLNAGELVKKLLTLQPDVSLILVEDHMLAEPGGQWNHDSKTLTFRRSVFERATSASPIPRSVFTVVHELVHCFFDHEGVRNRSGYRSIEKIAVTKVRRIETITDRLTSAVLAPLRFIEFDEAASSIAAKFGLSNQAANMRAEVASRYYRRKKGLQRPLPKFVTDLQAELRAPPKLAPSSRRPIKAVRPIGSSGESLCAICGKSTNSLSDGSYKCRNCSTELGRLQDGDPPY